MRSGAAILAAPVAETLKRVDGKKQITATVDRESLWAAQTPQVFRRELLIEAYAKRGKDAATDDAQLVERLGHPVTVVPCPAMNLKITTRDDLKLAEQVLKVLRLVDINEYKRRQAPIGVRITRRGFGRDRRYPVTSGWRLGD